MEAKRRATEQAAQPAPQHRFSFRHAAAQEEPTTALSLVRVVAREYPVAWATRVDGEVDASVPRALATYPLVAGVRVISE